MKENNFDPQDTDDIFQLFKLSVDRRQYPPKCLSCVYEGILYCHFWSRGFRCEVFDKLEEVHKLELLLARR